MTTTTLKADNLVPRKIEINPKIMEESRTQLLETFETSRFSTLIPQPRRGFKEVSAYFRKSPGPITLPTRATKYSMAYDFYSPIDLVIEPGKVGKIWTNVKAYMGQYECLILNVRSSQGGKVMLANTAGWIDMDYFENENNDGNIGIFLLNISDEPYEIKKGDRIAQGAFFNYLPSDNGNTDNERIGGFGSTNK